MKLQKTGADLSSAKKTVAPSQKGEASNITQKVQAKAAKTSAPVPQLRSASSLAKAAGLPNDKLSASLVTFARFFSLPLNPQTLAAIRRQAFLPQIHQTVSDKALPSKEMPDFPAAKAREALSLCAAAAESKGVELKAEALMEYAHSIDPEGDKNQNGQKKRQKDKDQDGDDQVKKTIQISASSLQKSVLQSSHKDPLLDILNRLPGKNGQRWIVLPFDFPEDENEYRVSMRILLEDETGRSSHMALDIAENNESCRRWLYILESANNSVMKLTACFPAEFSSDVQFKLKLELSDLLGIPLERVFFKSYTESFPFELADMENLYSIDEAV